MHRAGEVGIARVAVGAGWVGWVRGEARRSSRIVPGASGGAGASGMLLTMLGFCQANVVAGKCGGG